VCLQKSELQIQPSLSLSLGLHRLRQCAIDTQRFIMGNLTLKIRFAHDISRPHIAPAARHPCWWRRVLGPVVSTAATAKLQRVTHNTIDARTELRAHMCLQQGADSGGKHGRAQHGRAKHAASLLLTPQPPSRRPARRTAAGTPPRPARRPRTARTGRAQRWWPRRSGTPGRAPASAPG